jgi:hypothetical protein
MILPQTVSAVCQASRVATADTEGAGAVVRIAPDRLIFNSTGALHGMACASTKQVFYVLTSLQDIYNNPRTVKG